MLGKKKGRLSTPGEEKGCDINTCTPQKIVTTNDRRANHIRRGGVTSSRVKSLDQGRGGYAHFFVIQDKLWGKIIVGAIAGVRREDIIHILGGTNKRMVRVRGTVGKK